VGKTYKILYLKLAQSDLLDITDYIINKLYAPQAAIDLLDRLDEGISRLRQFPYSGHLYKSNKKFEDDIRMLIINNFLVFYVVYDHTVEVRRILYGKRNYEGLL